MNKITLTVLALTISVFSFSQGVVNTSYLREPYVGTYRSKLQSLYLSKYNFVLSWNDSSKSISGTWRLTERGNVMLLPENKHGMYIIYTRKKLSGRLCPKFSHNITECFRKQS